jgi:hypothetical protein
MLPAFKGPVCDNDFESKYLYPNVFSHLLLTTVSEDSELIENRNGRLFME